MLARLNKDGSDYWFDLGLLFLLRRIDLLENLDGIITMRQSDLKKSLYSRKKKAIIEANHSNRHSPLKYKLQNAHGRRNRGGERRNIFSRL